MSKEIKAPWRKFYDKEKYHLEYPDFSAYKLVEYTSGKHINNISYNYYGNKKTYKEFLEQIDTVAKSLKALGVKKRDVVSICVPNIPEGIIAFYAINKIGAISSMIHPLSAENEIERYLKLSKSEWLITIDFAFNKINKILKNTKVKKVITVSVAESMPMYMVPLYIATQGYKIRIDKCDKQLNWKEFIKLSKDYKKDIVEEGRAKDIVTILYSGGTSGVPKGVKLTNLNLNASAMQCFEHVACINEGDTALAIMPIFHGFGLSVCIHCAQYLGCTSILIPQFNAKTFDKIMKKYEPNAIIGVPTLYEAILNSKSFKHMKLDYLKCVISGGDSLTPELKKDFDSWLKKHSSPATLREGYGLTECCSASCLTPLNYYRENSIGIPLPDMYFKIVEVGTEKELPYGEVGEIVITGPTVMAGYIRNKKETNEALKKHKDGRIWLHTGDEGIMDKDGYVYFKGRLKRMIITSGYCVYPNNIENVINTHPDVKTSCVIGIPHPYKVTVAKAFIVLKNNIRPSEDVLASIKALVRKNLARFSWPYEYEFRDELPKTLVGKVAYNVLIHEEEAKNKNIKVPESEELLEQVEDESNSDKLIDKINKN